MPLDHLGVYFYLCLCYVLTYLLYAFRHVKIRIEYSCRYRLKAYLFGPSCICNFLYFVLIFLWGSA